MKEKYDVAIIGAGFSGSILARILSSNGRSVALVDAAKHPRFAIGESSTPIADRLLARLGERYGFADLVALSTYGSWQKKFPEIACGRKRGFSYYSHVPRREFDEDPLHDRSLLVAASAGDEIADTHWYRPQVDEFLFRQAKAAGAEDLTGCRVSDYAAGDVTCLTVNGESDSGSRVIECDWVIDASGASSVLGQLAKKPSRIDELKTQTYAVFAHLRGVESWRERLAESGHSVDDDPFDCDDAAQHHLLREGWMWMLRLDNGVTSVGITSTRPSPEFDWSAYPSLSSILRDSVVVAPQGGPFTSGRIQRLFDPIVGERALMLPTAAVTLDPLHSTGIAHALAGVERLASLMLAGDDATQREALETYRRSVLLETRLLDRLVATAYATMNDFPRFVAACMVYFAGAIRCEERYGAGETPKRLWNADDERFVGVVNDLCDRLAGGTPTPTVINEVRDAIEPWNGAGLMEPAARNRYAYTATKN